MSSTTEKPTRVRGRVRVEHGEKRVRAYLGGELVADTTEPLLVWEKPYYPTYYFPAADMRAELTADGGVSHSPSRGDAHAFTVRAGGTEAVGAALRYQRLAVRRAARRDPARLGRDGRLVRGGRGGVHAPARPVHACRHPPQLATRPDRARRRHDRRVDEADGSSSRPASPRATTCRRRTSASTCSIRATRPATAPTRVRPSTGRSGSATRSVPISPGPTGRRCRRARRSPV